MAGVCAGRLRLPRYPRRKQPSRDDGHGAAGRAENPEEHKEDYGYADPFGGDIELDIEIPDENPDITQDGQTASDETISDETGGETISGETVTGESTPSADAPDGEDSASADANNTEPAPETTGAAEGENT